MNLYEYATNLVVNKGLSVIPLWPKDKRPCIDKWEKYQRELPHNDELQDWFLNKTIEDVNIAVVTGKVSDIVVVDSDDGNRHPFGLDAGIVVETSKGYHLYYKYTPEVGNAVRIGNSKVDIRSDKGYVVFPPSIHESGKQYKFVKKDKLTALPKEFKDMLTKPSDTVRDILSRSTGVESGSRNDSLFRTLRSLMMDNSLTKRQVYDQILNKYNPTYNPPLDKSEVDKLVKNAYANYENKNRRPAAKPRTFSSLTDTWDEMNKLQKQAPSTGFRSLDEIIVGFIPGHLYTLTGETNSGKTQLAVNFAYHVAKQNKKVLYIALEPDVQILTSILSLDKDLPYTDIDSVKGVSKFIEDNLMILTQEDCTSLTQLKDILSEYVKKVDFIIVDHIGYFVSDTDNTVQAQSNLLKELAILSKNNKTAVLNIAHPKKGSTKLFSESRLTMHDIKGSSAFMQDSTEVLIIDRKHLEVEGVKQWQDEVKVYVDKKKVTSHSEFDYCDLIMPRDRAKGRDPKTSKGYVVHKKKEKDNTKMVEEML